MRTSTRKTAAAHDGGGTRRSQTNTNAAAGGAYASSTTNRAYHHSHAYAVSQQPLLTSWGLPDYLAHLSQILPTDVPRPLEVHGFSSSNGQHAVEVTTERGVKVKWPSKRMSVGDMNKRVRAMVEWVGREQASAAERTRRKEALEIALKAIQLSASEEHVNSGSDSRRPDAPVVLDGGTLTESPDQEKRTPILSSSNPIADALRTQDGSSTMKMMEELMEELIDFQERFGPGAKVKERERRAVAAAS